MNNQLKEQSNPYSTGGGGVNFETRVQAAFAVPLLTQTCIPCLLPSMKAGKLKFQDKYEGSNTDDFVLWASDKDGNTSKLYAQIKHAITIGEKDPVFSDVIKSAWSDFKSKSFDINNSVIALITGPLPKDDVNNTRTILEWARYSSSAEEFFTKSTTKGFTSKAKLDKLDIFKSQLTKANNGLDVSDDELWRFLKIFQLLSYDLDAKNSIVASLLCSLLSNYSTESPSLVFAKIVTLAQEFNQNAGTLDVDNIPTEIASLLNLSVNQKFSNDITKLQERGDHIFNGISNTVNNFHVDRSEELEKINGLYNTSDFVFVTGSRGMGKSGIVKDFISFRKKDVPVFYLRAEDLDKTHINDVFSSIGMTSTLSQIESYFALLPEKILVIESLEKILELTSQHAFNDLLQYIKKQTGWKIIATGRDYAYQQLAFNYLSPSGIHFTYINIDGFTQGQIEQIYSFVPKLKVLAENDALIELLKIPFFIEIAARAIGNGALFQSGDTEEDFRRTIWATVILKEADRKSAGMPAKRKLAFIELAKQRAKKMVFGISDNAFEAEVISKLEEDNLIYRDHQYKLISPMHDVLEDWALEEFIEEEYITKSEDLTNFLSAIGNEPAINRAFRLWLYRKVKLGHEINEFIERILLSDNVESYWKDETIAAILQSDSPEVFLHALKSQFLKNDCSLLIRFCFILRITCQQPRQLLNNLLTKDGKSDQLGYFYLRPYGTSWDAVITFFYSIRESLNESSLSYVVDVIDEWSGLININEDLPILSKTVGLLCLWLLEPLKDSYSGLRKRKKILGVLLKVSPAIQAEFEALIEQDVFICKRNPRRMAYVEELTKLALVGVNVPMLCKRSPDFIVKLALHEWFAQPQKEDVEDFFRYESIDVAQCFGLKLENDFFPSSGAKGPFQYLLHYHPKLGLDFILELCNRTAEKYFQSDFASSEKNEGVLYSHETVAKKVVLTLNDGTTVNQYSSPHLWKGYRGLSTLPYLLQCALMALENWLTDNVIQYAGENYIEWVFDYLLRSSNSVMPTSALASAAVGFSDKVGRAAYPLLRSPDLYYLDLERSVQELGGSEQNWFAFNTDVMSQIYTEERRKAALRPWRKETLETLLVKLQFEKKYQEDAFDIVDELINEASAREDASLRFMLHRIDTRAWVAVEDKESKRILFQTSSELPKDLKQIQNEQNAKSAQHNNIFVLHLWAEKLFNENDFKKDYFSSYNKALEAAKDLLSAFNRKELDEFSPLAILAVVKTAAVCVRDVLSDLSEEDRNWCCEIIFESVSAHADNLNAATVHDILDNTGSGACAFVLPKLLKYTENEEQRNACKHLIVMSFT